MQVFELHRYSQESSDEARTPEISELSTEVIELSCFQTFTLYYARTPEISGVRM